MKNNEEMDPWTLARHERACRPTDQNDNYIILKLSSRSTILDGQIDVFKDFFVDFFDEILISIDGIYILRYVDHEKH